MNTLFSQAICGHRQYFAQNAHLNGVESLDAFLVFTYRDATFSTEAALNPYLMLGYDGCALMRPDELKE